MTNTRIASLFARKSLIYVYQEIDGRFHSGTVYNTKNWKQPKCPLSVEEMSQTDTQSNNGIPRSGENE